MVAYSFVKRLTPNLALALAGGVGAIAALAALLLPYALFEVVVLTSGVAAFIPAAEPPLGVTARICLAVFVGGGVASLAWAGLSLLPGLLRLPDGTTRRGPTVRRADAHPDAPPREPLRAGRDLRYGLPTEETGALEAMAAEPQFLPPEPVIAMGASAPVAASFADPAAAALLSDRPAELAVRPLPTDLDQPLAAFDPGALPPEPLPPSRPVAPLHREPPRAPVFAEGERFETFHLSPPAPAAPPITGAQTVATVHSLLDRLERGIARRGQPAPLAPPPPPRPAPQPQGLAPTLEQLRRMAVQA